MLRFGATRRRFVSALALACTALFAWRSNVARAAVTPQPAPLETTLAAFLDTLLPADDLSPAASELGIAKAILGEASGDELYTRLIAVGCQFLDRAAEGSFGASNARVHGVIVEWMSQSDYDEVPRRFYELVRQRAVELYYSDARSWAGLAISRPPQPIGYPDHWK